MRVSISGKIIKRIKPIRFDIVPKNIDKVPNDVYKEDMTYRGEVMHSV